MRDLGAFVPGRRGTEPQGSSPTSPAPVGFAPASPEVIITPPPAPVAARSVFAGDSASGIDALGVEPRLIHLAELVAHRGTATPLCVGLFGSAGSGKSFSLQRLVERVREIGGGDAARGPFVRRLHLQSLDASLLEGDPTVALAARIHAGLRLPYPDLAREIGETARDPRAVLRETGEKLDEARRRLDSERRTQEESGSRLATLTETVLYDAAGSQVDSFARAHRSSLETRLSGFGITGDPIRAYKDLVRAVSESGAVGLSLRALHGFKGQTRLLVYAILLVLIGVGLGIAFEMRDAWLADLRAGPQVAATTGSWLEAHIGLLSLARKAAFALAGLAVLANVWRALNFVRPILTGVRLLKADLVARRRDLDGLYAHQTKRVDGLSADVDRLARVAQEAERRAGGSSAGTVDPSPFEQEGPHAHGFFTELGRHLKNEAKSGLLVPGRIVLALDRFEAIGADRARAIVDTLHRIAGECGLVILVALDPRRLGASLADLERWIQVPLCLDAGSRERDVTAIVHQTLGLPAGPAAVARRMDVTRSALDEAFGEPETALLAALAPLAGGSPRAVKRFVNLYTVARLDDDAPRGALAWMLALDQGGTVAEKHAIDVAIKGEPGAPLDLRETSARMAAALATTEAFDGRLTKADVTAAAARAALFSVSAFV